MSKDDYILSDEDRARMEKSIKAAGKAFFDDYCKSTGRNDVRKMELLQAGLMFYELMAYVVNKDLQHDAVTIAEERLMPLMMEEAERMAG